jgi:hypothetical protein
MPSHAQNGRMVDSTKGHKSSNEAQDETNLCSERREGGERFQTDCSALVASKTCAASARRITSPLTIVPKLGFMQAGYHYPTCGNTLTQARSQETVTRVPGCRRHSPGAP